MQPESVSHGAALSLRYLALVFSHALLFLEASLALCSVDHPSDLGARGLSLTCTMFPLACLAQGVRKGKWCRNHIDSLHWRESPGPVFLESMFVKGTEVR